MEHVKRELHPSPPSARSLVAYQAPFFAGEDDWIVQARPQSFPKLQAHVQAIQAEHPQLLGPQPDLETAQQALHQLSVIWRQRLTRATQESDPETAKPPEPERVSIAKVRNLYGGKGYQRFCQDFGIPLYPARGAFTVDAHDVPLLKEIKRMRDHKYPREQIQGKIDHMRKVRDQCAANVKPV